MLSRIWYEVRWWIWLVGPLPPYDNARVRRWLEKEPQFRGGSRK